MQFEKYIDDFNIIILCWTFLIVLFLFVWKKNSDLKKIIYHQIKKIERLQHKNKKEFTTSSQTKKSTKNKWIEFLKDNKRINPKIISHLKEKKLTLGEIRLCILVHSQLNDKEISNVLCINTKSVYMKRHRVCKKLNLESSMILSKYLNSLT
tara:strand:+ start:68 stop:523 length:456 start_codon:yes stop_codon:yes gene_type:complete